MVKRDPPVVIVGLVGLFAVTVIRDYGRDCRRQTNAAGKRQYAYP